MQNANHHHSTKPETQHGASESEAMGKSIAPPAFQLKADGEDGSTNNGAASQHSSLAAPPFQLKASSAEAASANTVESEAVAPVAQRKQTDKSNAAVGDIPESPGGFPFEGKILPDAAKMYAEGNPGSAILATLPKNQKLQVLGGDQWLHCQTTFGGKSYDGYVMHSDIKREMAFTNTTAEGTSYTSVLSLLNDQLAITKEVNFISMGGFEEQGGDWILRGRMIAAAREYLSNKFKLRIRSTDGQYQAGDGVYPISVNLSNNPSAEYPIELYGGHIGRSNMRQDKGEIYELGQSGDGKIWDITLAHEASHVILGTGDEYYEPEHPERQVFKDHSLVGAYRSEGIEEAEIKERHFAFLIRLAAQWFPDRNISIIQS
ncbi:MAG: hypothetical protein RLZZ519_1268 [Bacteroidota bacterium]|jgi:hypothetical protein